MSVRARVSIDGRSFALRPLGASALVLGLDACPRCKRREEVHVQGSGERITGHDTVEADGFARCCGQRLGTITATVPTVFGLEEDARVLAGPWRVY